MKRTSGADAASTYWQSVELAAASTDAHKARRAAELIRLREVAERYRQQWFPELPELTIDAIPLGGRSSAQVDPIGGWGQGLSIKVKASRIDPFHWSPAVTEQPAAGAPAKDKSLIFGAPLRQNLHGEVLRGFEAELIVLQQMLRAEQHRVIEVRGHGHADAKSDLTSWGGFGEWFATQANTIWKQWCTAEGYPFVPVRHSRSQYESEHRCIAGFEADQTDGVLTRFRPSCSRWPMVTMSQARDPIATGDIPADCPEITAEIWSRWQQEQSALTTALVRRIDTDVMVLGLVWPDGQLPQIDVVEGEPVVELPAVTAAIPQSQNVTLNFNAADALQTVEAVLTRVDRERGLSLWPEFLQLAADHPQSPKASKVQTALAVDLDDDDEPTPIDPGDDDAWPAPAELTAVELDVVTNPERSESQLRKVPESCELPPWPSNSRPKGTGERVRLTKEQTALLEEQIELLLVSGLTSGKIVDRLKPWCGQRTAAIRRRVHDIRERTGMAQELVA